MCLPAVSRLLGVPTVEPLAATPMSAPDDADALATSTQNAAREAAQGDAQSTLTEDNAAPMANQDGAQPMFTRDDGSSTPVQRAEEAMTAQGDGPATPAQAGALPSSDLNNTAPMVELPSGAAAGNAPLKSLIHFLMNAFLQHRRSSL